MDALIDFHARPIVGRNDKRVLGRFRILLRNGCNTFSVTANPMHAALRSKVLNSFPYLSPRKMLYHLFEFRVFLADNLLELHRLHTGILKLGKGPPSLDCLMLPPVAYQQYPVVRMEPVYEFLQLPCRCQRGFVEDIQAFPAFVG